MYESEKFWDKRSGKFDTWVDPDDKDDQVYVEIIELAKKHLKADDTILDHACGTGIHSLEIAHQVKEIQAIDISSRMIEIARQSADERGIENITFAQADIFDARFQPGTFDAILAFNILHLLEGLEIVMGRMNELLKPGGLLISSTPCLGDRLALLRFFLPLFRKLRVVPYVKVLKSSELKDTICGGNFQIVGMERAQQSPQNHHIVARKVE